MDSAPKNMLYIAMQRTLVNVLNCRSANVRMIVSFLEQFICFMNNYNKLIRNIERAVYK